MAVPIPAGTVRQRSMTNYARIMKSGSSIKLLRQEGQRPGLVNRLRLSNTKPQERQQAGSINRRGVP